MKVTPTRLSDVLLIEPVIHADARGIFVETFNAKVFELEAGIHRPFVQDNFSRSHNSVLRGLHAQKKTPQGKLIRVVNGKVYDVAVDIRVKSSTFGEWVAVQLSAENQHQLWIPPGFAHGFVVLTPFADIEYKCTEFYDQKDEIGVAWNDEELNITWPVAHPILNEKDQNWPSLRHLKSEL